MFDIRGGSLNVLTNLHEENCVCVDSTRHGCGFADERCLKKPHLGGCAAKKQFPISIGDIRVADSHFSFWAGLRRFSSAAPCHSPWATAGSRPSNPTAYPYYQNQTSGPCRRCFCSNPARGCTVNRGWYTETGLESEKCLVRG